MFYTIGLCKSKAAYETRLSKELRLNMMDVESAMIKLNYAVLKSTPVISVFKREYTVHAYPSGRLIIDDATEDASKKTAEEIYKALKVKT